MRMPSMTYPPRLCAPIWPACVEWNVVTDLFAFLLRHAFTGRADFPRHAREREKRRVECRRSAVVEFGRMARDLARKRKRVLRADHKKLRRQLDDVCRDQPTVLRRRECMYRQTCVGRDRPCSRHKIT